MRFTVRGAHGALPAFAIRHRGVVHAYLNVCAHQQVELDWLPGAFFDVDRETLVCALHGARYAPDTGRCVSGACTGGKLVRVPVVVRDDGAIVLNDHRSIAREEDPHG